MAGFLNWGGMKQAPQQSQQQQPQNNQQQGNQQGNQQQNFQQHNPQASEQQQQGPANSNFQQSGAPSGGNNNPAPQGLDRFAEMFGSNGNQNIQGGAAGPQGQPVPQNMNQQGGQQQQPPAQPEYDGYTQPWQGDQLRQRFSTVNFAQSAPKELMTRAMAGNDPEALIELMNHTAREVFLSSTQTAHGFVDKGVKTGLDRFKGGLDDHFRDYQVRNQNPDNEVLNHAAVKPMFSAMKNLIAQQNPNMSPQEVLTMANEWFNDVSTAMGSKKTTQEQSQNAPKTTDWSKSFGVDESQMENIQPTGF